MSDGVAVSSTQGKSSSSIASMVMRPQPRRGCHVVDAQPTGTAGTVMRSPTMGPPPIGIGLGLDVSIDVRIDVGTDACAPRVTAGATTGKP